MKLFMRYLSILFRSQMQYKTSFWLLTVGQFFTPFTMIAGIWFLFERFGSLRGWDFHEVAICFAVIHMAFAISECFARGFDTFASLIVSGDFDRLLVRPRSTFLQVLGSKFEFTRIGRLAQSSIVLIWATASASIDWTPLKALTLGLMILSGTIIFAGIFILVATLCFWTVQGLEIANILTNGGKEMAQYPLQIYERWVVRFFTFIIPFGCVNYLPLQYILGRTDGDEMFYSLTPLAGFLFFFLCLIVWQFGVRHYRSTGS
jgi:ABC-2 type transport system permease protein